MATMNMRMQMKHDTLQNWENNNPVLLAGEWGIAIDSDSGTCVVKVGDGIHPWNELSLELGQKKSEIIEKNKESARVQPKDLRSELKTLTLLREYDLTEVHSDVEFDF